MKLHSILPTLNLAELHALHFERPHAFYLFGLVGVLLLYWLWQAGSIRRWGAPYIRALVLTCLVLALAQPFTSSQSAGPARPAVIDISASMTPSMRQYTIKLLRKLKYHAADPALLFAGVPVNQSVADAMAVLAGRAACAPCSPGTSDLEAALTKLATDPAAHNGRVVMVTDGWQNRGDAAKVLGAIRKAGIRLEIFTPPGAEAAPNVAMNELNLPAVLEKAQPFSLSVTMTNLNAVAAGGTIALYRNGTLVERRTIVLPPGQSRYDFPVRSEDSGLVAYRAVFQPADPALDLYREDDSLQGWVGIGAQRKVLLLTDSSRDAGYLATVVSRMGFRVTTLPLDRGEYVGNPAGYDAVILNNVARAHLSAAAQNALVHFVAAGGALAMVGGDQSFGLGGYQDSPLAKLMPVVMKPPQHRVRTRALVLIIDKSGSMGRENKLAYAKMAAQTVLKTLKDNDLVSVIGFDVQPFVVVPLEPLREIRPYFSQLVDRLRPQGRTFLLPALEESRRVLGRSGAASKHIVILTDGETGGTAEMYYDLVSTMHHEGGTTISTIAIGREANSRLLQAIATYGGGGFYQTDSPENLPQLFLQDVRQRSSDTTMVEKDFVPYSPPSDPVLKDLAGRQLPPIKGFVTTELKPGADLSLFVNREGRRVPIVASWRFGAGKALAVTTDASGRWSSQWVREGVFGPVWNRLLGWLTPPAAARQNFGVALGYRAGRIQLNLTDYSNGAASNMPITAQVIAPDGSKYEALLSKEAPGELSGSIEAPAAGTYNIQLKMPHSAGEPGFPPLAYTVSPAVYAELPRPEPNYRLLEHLALASGGAMNPAPEQVALTRAKFDRTTSLAPWLVVAGMVLLIGEALVRRLTF